MRAFIDVKGMKAQGNVFTKLKTKDVLLEPKEANDLWPDEVQEKKLSDDEKADLLTGETPTGEAVKPADDDQENQNSLFK